MAYAETDLSNVTLNGSQIKINTTSGSSGQEVGEYIVATNATNTGQYSIRKATLIKTADLSDGSNDIAETAISRYNSMTFGFSWLHWDVTSSPLAFGSGLPGAPTASQRFAMVIGEGNPQNRHSDPGWEAESRLWANWVGGYQMVPETQDFSALLSGKRVGYNITFAHAIARSPFCSNVTNRHARYYNGFFGNPNCLAPNGAFLFCTGFKSFVITPLTVVSGGSGYQVGDILTFNSGLDQRANEDAQVQVTSVGASGAITGVEIWNAGWYQQSLSNPVTVTGGHGSGASLAYTLASDTAEAPRAWGGLAGTFQYGIDAVNWAGANSNVGSAHFLKAMLRGPNDNNLIVARNAANTADVLGLKLNSADQWELDSRVLHSWKDYAPTISTDAGALGSLTVIDARYSRINNVVTVCVNILINAIGSASGAIRISLPVPAARSFTGSGANLSDATVLTVLGNAGGLAMIRATKYDGSSPISAGKYFNVTASYEVI